VQALVDREALGPLLKSRHATGHQIRTNKILYRYTMEIKNTYLRKSGPLSKVIFDEKISLSHQALGLHTYISRPHGNRLKAKNEIRISSLLKNAPEGMLRAVVVHELAHIKEKDHNKAFYKLCTYMEPKYHKLEFDLRLFLILLSFGRSL